MACTPVKFSPAATAAAEIAGMRRSKSGNDLLCDLGARIRRSRSESQLRCSLIVPKVSAAAAPAAQKAKGGGGVLPFTMPGASRSFLFESEEIAAVDCEASGEDLEKRANWVERLMELRSRWRERPQTDDGDGDDDYYCGVGYESEEEEEWDREKFSRLLTKVTWSETKLFSKLAFLCNMAYVIPEIKAEDLRRYYDLRLVTSSLKKKSEAAIKAKLYSDSTRLHLSPTGSDRKPTSVLNRPPVAYEIAASATSYVRSRTKGLLSIGGSHELVRDGVCPTGTGSEHVYESEVAGFVAASTMTAMVAADEEARLEAAKDLQSLHSSPCEWFMCDHPNTCIRCFVIQGSDSLASWQANLLFEPTKFEGTKVLVHRGIYEAAKGIYEQFLPEILTHLKLYGDQARFRFIGHSLGGSLSLLVNLMIRARGLIPPSSLLPVVTFGSPSVFCGGNRVIDELGLDEDQFCSVMMHRDIVPRAFSCNYPNQVARVLKRLNGAFRSHPCLNSQKLLYTPLGKLFILQPDEKSSPSHPLLPNGAALYSFNTTKSSNSALKAFLNSPHPLEMLSKPTAYGSEGTILRDHDSTNYLKAINALIRQQTKSFARRSRKQRLNHWWPLLMSERPGLVPKEVVTSV